jgi:hypothetical protein
MSNLSHVDRSVRSADRNAGFEAVFSSTIGYFGDLGKAAMGPQVDLKQLRLLVGLGLGPCFEKHHERLRESRTLETQNESQNTDYGTPKSELELWPTNWLLAIDALCCIISART